MDFVRRWSEKTEIAAGRFIGWLDVAVRKFYDWRERHGKVNEHVCGRFRVTDEVDYFRMADGREVL